MLLPAADLLLFTAAEAVAMVAAAAPAAATTTAAAAAVAIIRVILAPIPVVNPVGPAVEHLVKKAARVVMVGQVEAAVEPCIRGLETREMEGAAWQMAATAAAMVAAAATLAVAVAAYLYSFQEDKEEEEAGTQE